ncbi:Coenzyme F420 hydrogenase/dehydrogenase, beta subunit C-terminal domain [Idiomarina sp. UBA3162]|uniref:Coenzyme F420 hydrogenase/dehydrogenase, beta subunit C-terminal domain n=1 Tax=Idiomarina sp. UBA3162 TaxID=1946641 RepID=UPI0025BEA6D5|nr:Coenzyme F420 hydrogenase/dehydrogenase, beta subunit C-terminal domain [Idiomarina sp. UBA3162]
MAQSKKGRMFETVKGTYIPDLAALTKSEIESAENFCPFAKASDIEDVVASKVFKVNNLRYLEGLGYYHKTYAGYAIEGKFREQGSSAGLVNWLCSKLLRDGYIDTIIHVKEDTSSNNKMYSYQESSDIESLQSGAKSKYYPVELSEVVKALLSQPSKKVAIVGLPCFIKALRAYEEDNLQLKEQIKFHIGIVCGHLKSKNYAKFLGWQAGIEPNNLKLIDFRTKLKKSPASRYGFTAIPRVGSEDSWIIKPMSEVVGGNWGHGVFKLTACEYCDDIMAETSDIVFGDAWLPEFVGDSGGTNIINSRSPFLSNLLQDGDDKGLIKLQELTPKRVLDSQRSGLRHRREGLSYRSGRDEALGKPFPKKRTKPNSHQLNIVRKTTYEYRELIRQTSHKSFLLAADHRDLSISLSMLKPIIESYSKISRVNLIQRIIAKAKKVLTKLVQRNSN